MHKIIKNVKEKNKIKRETMPRRKRGKIGGKWSNKFIDYRGTNIN